MIMRYSLDYENCNLEYDPEGDIIDYGDHCAVVHNLQSRLEELNQEVEGSEKENRYLNDGCAELEAHIQALEKENASLKQDAERLDWLEASKDMHGFCHSGYGEYRYYAHQVNGFKSVREVIDTAMQVNEGN